MTATAEEVDALLAGLPRVGSVVQLDATGLSMPPVKVVEINYPAGVMRLEWTEGHAFRTKGDSWYYISFYKVLTF